MFKLMLKCLEETVMFTNEDESFQELFDRLLAHSSTKQSVKMNEFRKQSWRDDPMDVHALSREKKKEKGKKGPGGSGKGNKDQNHMNDVKFWNCGRSGHYGRDCREVVRRQGKRKEKRRQRKPRNERQRQE